LFHAGLLCKSCASGFYLRPDGTCAECPNAAGTSSIAEKVKAALPFASALLGSFGIVAALLFKLVRLSGEDDAKRAWVKVSLCPFRSVLFSSLD
jgi:hypothetical protein